MIKLIDVDELLQLRQENARLKELLTRHGVTWDTIISSGDKDSQSEPAPAPLALTVADKIALFRSLFCGREDVFAQRWESGRAGSGYTPACGNAWKPGICQKPKVKCSDCNHRQLLAVTNQVIFDHLAGKHTVGIYPPPQ